MIRIYRGTMAGYIISCAIAALGMIFLINVMEMNVFLAFLLVAIWIFGCAFIFTTVAARKYRETVNPKLNNCHVRDYIAENKRLMPRCNGRKPKNFFNINISTAYFALGDIEGAKEHLLRVNQKFGKGRMDVFTAGVFCNNFVVLYTREGNFEKAEQAIDSLRALRNNPKLKEAQRKIISEQIEEKSICLNLAKGIYDGAREFYAERLSTAETLLKKVDANYHLGDICLHSGEKDEAAEHFRFVIENGGDTFYVALAEKGLAECSRDQTALQ